MVDTCVLGLGPCGYLAMDKLIRMGARTCAVGASELGSLMPLTINGKAVNPVPIVSPQNNSLFKDHTLQAYGLLSVRKTPFGLRPQVACDPHSLYSSLGKSKNESIPQRLALKQYGHVVQERKCNELAKKIFREYSRSGEQKIAKIGYKDGLSPYFELISKLRKGPVIVDRIISINASGARYVVQTSKREIKTKTIVSTIPLPMLLNLLSVKHTLRFFASQAEFSVLKASGSTQENVILYDLDAASPVFRYFIPTKGVLVVQHSVLARDCVDVAERTQREFGFADKPERVSHFTIRNAYPLDVLPIRKKKLIERCLKANGIVSVGRFGSWTYVDLHEIDWSVLNALS